MPLDRRRLLQSLPPFAIASSFPVPWHAAFAAAPKLTAALLIPKTGEFAALGRSMERAAALAQAANPANGLLVFDTGGTAGGAADAARAARKARASIVLGPVFAREVSAVLGVIGRSAPVITFSNDAGLLESGAFLLGLTARQSVQAILTYAAGRGIRRFAISAAADGWGAQASAAALALAPTLGLAVTPLALDAAGLPAGTGPADGLPDAVLATDSAALARMAPTLGRLGVQALGAFQSVDFASELLATLEGAWLAAPDPARFSAFARAYEARNGSLPGMIAGLAYDAAKIAQQLRLGGGSDRSALLAAAGFKGVCGDLRFREDGSAARSLAILEVSRRTLKTVAAAAAV